MRIRFVIITILATALLACGDPGSSKEHQGDTDRTMTDHDGEHQRKRKREHKNMSPVFHTTHEPLKKDAPFSDVVQVGQFYFLSGQIGMDHSLRELVSGGIEGQTRQTLENIKAVLAQHDLEMSDVIKAMVVLDDMADFAAFNTVYREYLPQKPARTTFAAKGLAVGALVEIEVVAVKSE